MGYLNLKYQSPLLPLAPSSQDGVIDPVSLAGWAGLYDERSARWQDTAGTSPAVTNGQSVKRIDDLSSALRNLTEASTPPTLSNTALAFTVGGSGKLAASWSPGTLGDFSLHILVRQTSATSGVYGGIASLNSTGTSSLFVLPWTTGLSGKLNYVKSPWIIGNAPNYILFSFVRSGSTLYTYIDGCAVDSIANSEMITPDQIGICATQFGGCDANVLAFGVATVAHTSVEIAGIAAFWREQSWTRPVNGCVLVSNSLGAGEASGFNLDLLKKVQVGGYAPSVSAYWNASVGAKTTTQMLADHATRTTPLGSIPTGKTCFVLWEGTNDFALNATTGAQAASNLFTLASQIKATYANARVVIVTIIDRGSLVGFNTFKAACNAALISGAAAAGVTIADLTGVSNVSADGAYANATYFADDQHLNGTGNDQIKSIVGAAIETALA